MSPARATSPVMPHTPATYDDLRATPEGVRAELIDGELILQSAPAVLHQRIALRMGADLVTRFERTVGDGPDRPGGWVLIAGPELWLGKPNATSLVLCPDLAGWRQERFRNPTTHGIQVAPDWICEVLSPSTQRHDRLTKADAYARAGVAWMWLIDPDAALVEVYEQRDGLWTRVRAAHAAERTTLPPFDGELDLGSWWPAT